MNKNVKTRYVISIFLLCLYHFYIHNGLEKIFFRSYFDYNDVRRPLKKCNNDPHSKNLSCIGTPSGHAETGSLFLFLLYFNNLIPLWGCLILIICISIQRMITDMHTFDQVCIGSLFGLLYAFIYNYFNLFIAYGFIYSFKSI